MGVLPGLAASAGLEVKEGDTALVMGTGAVPVLATPRLIALCEEATMAALAGSLNEGCSTVGVGFQIEHIAPCAVGTHIVAEAHLDRIEGRKLLFTVSARDSRGLVAAGKVTRVIIEMERFMEKTR